MQIKLTSLMVDDQDKALQFYSGVLGLPKKHEIPMGPYKWLTVEAANGVEMSLEPNANPAGKAFQEAMYAQKIPLATFEVGDIAAEYSRLKAHGVEFLKEPVSMGPVIMAQFSDTCGNWIRLYQPSV